MRDSNCCQSEIFGLHCHFCKGQRSCHRGPRRRPWCKRTELLPTFLCTGLLTPQQNPIVPTIWPHKAAPLFTEGESCQTCAHSLQPKWSRIVPLHPAVTSPTHKHSLPPCLSVDDVAELTAQEKIKAVPGVRKISFQFLLFLPVQNHFLCVCKRVSVCWCLSVCERAERLLSA